jgi:hypothetical protein
MCRYLSASIKFSFFPNVKLARKYVHSYAHIHPSDNPALNNEQTKRYNINAEIKNKEKECLLKNE